MIFFFAAIERRSLCALIAPWSDTKKEKLESKSLVMILNLFYRICSQCMANRNFFATISGEIYFQLF